MDRLALPLPKIIFRRILPFALALATLRAESVDGLLARATALEARKREAGALALYLRANELRPHDADILLLVARQYLRQADDGLATGENRNLARRAVDYAEQAKAADPGNAEARLCLAICYGRAALLEPPSRRMEYSARIKGEAEAAVRLDPSLDNAWHVLGRWNYELANLNPALRFVAEGIFGRFPAASNERAAECFEKAIALQPRRVIHHGELGRTYAALGRKDEARAELKRSLDLPSRDKDDDESKARARQALAALD
jgi:tetratricopeptide (TPR) repeat protein